MQEIPVCHATHQASRQPAGWSDPEAASKFIVPYFELPNLLFLHTFPNIFNNVNNVILIVL